MRPARSSTFQLGARLQTSHAPPRPSLHIPQRARPFPPAAQTPLPQLQMMRCGNPLWPAAEFHHLQCINSYAISVILSVAKDPTNSRQPQPSVLSTTTLHRADQTVLSNKKWAFAHSSLPHFAGAHTVLTNSGTNLFALPRYAYHHESSIPSWQNSSSFWRSPRVVILAHRRESSFWRSRISVLSFLALSFEGAQGFSLRISAHGRKGLQPGSFSRKR